jgi:mRNA-degrading endonuclease toxin of MazEF toxin-antitoxin module
MIEQGQVYYVDDGAGGRRPVIVVAQESFNRGRYLCVVPRTTKRFQLRKSLPNCVPLTAGQFGCSSGIDGCHRNQLG